jgi:hypothetical protein
MDAPDLRSPGAGQVITAPDPGVIPETLAQATPPSRRVVDGKIS